MARNSDIEITAKSSDMFEKINEQLKKLSDKAIEHVRAADMKYAS